MRYLREKLVFSGRVAEFMMNGLDNIKKTLIIAGAGQFGRAAAGLLNERGYDLISFADNDENKQGTTYTHPLGRRIPVCSVRKGVEKRPDAILIGVIDEERSAHLTEQIRSEGFEGDIIPLRSVQQLLDVRSAALLRLAQRINERGVTGAAAELGVYKGDLAWKINALFPDREIYLFDTFIGFDSRDVTFEKVNKTSRAAEGDFGDTSIDTVKSRLPHPEMAHFAAGFFPDTAVPYSHLKFAFVSLDADLYAPILAGLEFFMPRLSAGGMILLHDYGNERFRGARKAVEDYEAAHGPLHLVPLCDLHGSAVILK